MNKKAKQIIVLTVVAIFGSTTLAFADWGRLGGVCESTGGQNGGTTYDCLKGCLHLFFLIPVTTHPSQKPEACQKMGFGSD